MILSTAQYFQPIDKSKVNTQKHNINMKPRDGRNNFLSGENLAIGGKIIT